MEYSFECGSCHAIYKLDEKQITDKGVKITCPKCLSYFILRKGSFSASSEAAYVEYVVQDGLQENSLKTPPPQIGFGPDVKTEKIVSYDKTEKIPLSKVTPSKRGFSSVKTKGKIKDGSFEGPYPTLKKSKEKKALSYIFVLVIIVGIFWILWSIL